MLSSSGPSHPPEGMSGTRVQWGGGRRDGTRGPEDTTVFPSPPDRSSDKNTRSGPSPEVTRTNVKSYPSIHPSYSCRSTGPSFPRPHHYWRVGPDQTVRPVTIGPVRRESVFQWGGLTSRGWWWQWPGRVYDPVVHRGREPRAKPDVRYSIFLLLAQT